MPLNYVLVAGGLGYIGSHVVIVLIKAGYNVIIVDDLSNSKIEKYEEIKKVLSLEGFSNANTKANALIFHKTDLTDKNATLKLFTKYQIHTVIALAGLKSVSESTIYPIKYYATNLAIINNLLLGVDTRSQKSCNFIFSSTGTVYNSNNSLPYKETDDIGKELSNPYSTSKYLIERLLEDVAKHNKNINITNLRYFNPVGNHSSGLLADNPRYPTNLFPIITKSIIENKQFQIFGQNYDTSDGTCERDYISVEDVASAHLVVLMRQIENSNYDVFNVGLGKSVSVLNIVKTYENVNNIKLNYSIGPPRNGDLPITVGDPNKLKLLGWTPKWTLEDCVRHSYTSLNRGKQFPI